MGAFRFSGFSAFLLLASSCDYPVRLSAEFLFSLLRTLPDLPDFPNDKQLPSPAFGSAENVNPFAGRALRDPGSLVDFIPGKSRESHADYVLPHCIRVAVLVL